MAIHPSGATLPLAVVAARVEGTGEMQQQPVVAQAVVRAPRTQAATQASCWALLARLGKDIQEAIQFMAQTASVEQVAAVPTALVVMPRWTGHQETVAMVWAFMLMACSLISQVVVVAPMCKALWVAREASGVAVPGLLIVTAEGL